MIRETSGHVGDVPVQMAVVNGFEVLKLGKYKTLQCWPGPKVVGSKHGCTKAEKERPPQLFHPGDLQVGDPGTTEKCRERESSNNRGPPIHAGSVSFPVPLSSLRAKDVQDNSTILYWQAGNNRHSISHEGVCVCICN